MSDRLWYPSAEDVVDIHDDIVSEYPDTSPGVRNRGDVEFALEYVEEGSFGAVPETVHEKAFYLLRLLVASPVRGREQADSAQHSRRVLSSQRLSVRIRRRS